MKNNQSGVITLELLIGLALILGAVIAIVYLVIYCQDMLVDSQTNQEALLIVENNLENIRIQSQQDFNTVFSTSTQVLSLYNLESEVKDYKCEKVVENSVSWDAGNLRPKLVGLRTILDNLSEIKNLGLDCSRGLLGDDWLNLNVSSTLDFLPATASTTSVDILEGIAFIGVVDTIASNPDLYIVNLTDINNPVLLYSLNTGSGINNLDSVLINEKYYIYIAQNNNTNQFQIVEFNNNLLTAPVLVAGISLPGVSATGSYPQGRTIFYYNSLVYIATHRTAGRELQVYSVQANPASPIWKGSIEINHNINDLYVRKQKIGGVDKILVYMATSGNADDLMVVDASDPSNLLKLTSAFQDLPGNEDGRSLFVSGNKLYLGRYKSTTPSHDDFYILDISHPEISVNVEASENLGINDVTNVLVSGNRVVASGSGGAVGVKVLNYTNGTLTPIENVSGIQSVSGLDFESMSLIAVNNSGHDLVVLKVVGN